VTYSLSSQFFEHLEEMIIFDTGRGCARAILRELVTDNPARIPHNSTGERFREKREVKKRKERW
jgi:hypothetical protein